MWTKEQRREYQRQYRSTPEYKTKIELYRAEPEYKAKKARRRLVKIAEPGYRVKKTIKQKEYRKTDSSKIKRRERRQTLEYKNKKALYHKTSSRFKSWRKERNKIKNKDPKYKVGKKLSHAILMSLKRGVKAHQHWEDLVGYTAKDLKRHLEGLWLPGMSWDNYKFKGWQIDHIIPKSLWEYYSPNDSEFKQCWALCNLQPLWAKDNIRKSNKCK